MSKADLKAAMESLQVRKPLRLPSRAPAFVPPPSEPAAPTPVENPTTVDNATQVEKHTEVVNPTQVGNQAEVSNPTEDQKQTPVGNTTPVANTTPVENPTQGVKTTPADFGTPVIKTTQVETQTQVQKPTQAAESTQVPKSAPVEKHTTAVKPTQAIVASPEMETDSVTLTRRATEQDSSVVLEARAADGLERGYTRLPNSVLMQLASGDYTRNEIKLALLVARFTISFQRKLAPLSKMVLERRSGLRGAAVLEALAGLVAKGLVEKQQGDQHRPNMLGLVLPPDWDTLMKPKGEAEATPVENPTPVTKPTQAGNSTPVANAASAPVAKPTPAVVGNPTHFKDIKIYKNNSSLSTLPSSLQKYFDELKPAKKRESEWQALEGLLGDYQAEDIADCLMLLQDRGIVRRGPNGQETQPCHSPMAYLSKAMAEVFLEVEMRRQRGRERIERENREAAVERRRVEEEAREAALWEKKEQAFASAFPTRDQQREVLTELLKGLPFSPDSQPGRIMGIGRWYEQQTL